MTNSMFHINEDISTSSRLQYEIIINEIIIFNVYVYIYIYIYNASACYDCNKLIATNLRATLVAFSNAIFVYREIPISPRCSCSVIDSDRQSDGRQRSDYLIIQACE